VLQPKNVVFSGIGFTFSQHSKISIFMNKDYH
jgi:hypothetical protein